MRRLFVIAIAVWALTSSAVLAQDRQQATTLKVDLEGRTIAVPAPFGYCDLDPAQPRDQLLIAGFDRLWKAPERVLRRMSPCDELESWRAEKTQDPIEVVLTIFQSQYRTTSGDRRSYLRRTAPGEPTGRDGIIDRAGEGFHAGPAEDRLSTIGVIERNDRAALLAEQVIIRIDDKNRDLSVLAARTAIGSTPILIHVYSPYDDGSELDWMLRDAREHVDRLLSANGESSRRFRESRPSPQETAPGDVRTRKTRVPRERTTGFFDINGGYIALGMVIVGTLLIGISLVVARRLRPAP